MRTARFQTTHGVYGYGADNYERLAEHFDVTVVVTPCVLDYLEPPAESVADFSINLLDAASNLALQSFAQEPSCGYSF